MDNLKQQGLQNTYSHRKGHRVEKKQAQESLAAAMSLGDISDIVTSWAECYKKNTQLLQLQSLTVCFMVNVKPKVLILSFNSNI